MYTSKKIIITDHKIHNGVKEAIEYFKWDSVEYCIISKNKTSKLIHVFSRAIASKFKRKRRIWMYIAGIFGLFILSV